jgi:hypothetical protein
MDGYHKQQDPDDGIGVQTNETTAGIQQIQPHYKGCPTEEQGIGDEGVDEHPQDTHPSCDQECFPTWSFEKGQEDFRYKSFCKDGDHGSQDHASQAEELEQHGDHTDKERGSPSGDEDPSDHGDHQSNRRKDDTAQGYLERLQNGPQADFNQTPQGSKYSDCDKFSGFKLHENLPFQIIGPPGLQCD